MVAPGNSAVQIVLAMAFVIASGYAAGRIHQWYKHCMDRDEAFRLGYNEASRSMFDMAVNNRRGRSPEGSPRRPQVGLTVTTVQHAARFAPANADRDVLPNGIHRRHSVGSSRRRISAKIDQHLGRRRSAA